MVNGECRMENQECAGSERDRDGEMEETFDCDTTGSRARDTESRETENKFSKLS